MRRGRYSPWWNSGISGANVTGSLTELSQQKRSASFSSHIYDSPYGPLVTAVCLVCIVLVPLWYMAAGKYEKQLIAEERSRFAVELAAYGNGMTTNLNRRFARLEGLHAFVLANRSSDELEKKFDVFAAGHLLFC